MRSPSLVLPKTASQQMVSSPVAIRSKDSSDSSEGCLLLVIDDDASVKLLVERALEGLCRRVVAATTAYAGLQQLEKICPDIIVLDNVLPDSTGIEVLKRIHEFDSSIPVIFITARGTGATAIEAMKFSAFDYLPKPLDFAQLRKQVERAVELNTVLSNTAYNTTDLQDGAQENPTYLVGETASMQEVFKAIGKSAGLDIPVLVRGENGTGKESVARTIHDYSRFADGPFLKLHCPAFDEARFEAELFGVVDQRGQTAQSGRIQQASEGTLLLEEVGNMPLSMQNKLLRTLRDGVYEPLGSEVSVHVQSRLLFTSNQDLEALVREGRFRADLYYLLSAFVISLPPLRQRRNDLPLLIDHLLKNISPHTKEEQSKLPKISQEALDRLCQHTWPGNIDELQSVLKRSLIESKGNVILSDTLHDAVSRDPVLDETRMKEHGGQTDWSMFVDLRVDAGTSELYSEAVAEMERKLLSRVLQHTSGNQAHASKILGITRTSLRKKLRMLSINVQQVIQLGGKDASAKSTEL